MMKTDELLELEAARDINKQLSLSTSITGKRLKITSCYDSSRWYAKRVGEEFIAEGYADSSQKFIMVNAIRDDVLPYGYISAFDVTFLD